MPMTNAERQASFRFRQKTQGRFKSEGTPMERLDAWVSSDAVYGLRVLAALNTATVQQELDRLILAAIAAKKQEIGKQVWSGASLEILDKNRVTG